MQNQLKNILHYFYCFIIKNVFRFFQYIFYKKNFNQKSMQSYRNAIILLLLLFYWKTKYTRKTEMDILLIEMLKIKKIYFE